ncbi:MAG: hypothetical protein FJ295_17975 [Planctomycetes bacterium]|nr:hypothetical protein [Planctomycetota bacterium]
MATVAAMASITVATIPTMATIAVATTMALFAIALVLTTATSVAATTIALLAAAATATIAAVTSNRFLLTARQGDADDREKCRDPKNDKTIHPRSSIYLQVP